MSSCQTFWGSHGCNLPAGHTGIHVCLVHEWVDEDAELPNDPRTGVEALVIQPCSIFDGKKARYSTNDTTWSETYPARVI